MPISNAGSESSTLTLDLGPAIDLGAEELFELCQRNRDLRIERNATGQLLLMSPAGGKTSARNAVITAQLWLWARQNGQGRAFDSSGGFLLPNGALRAPDAAWVELARLRELPSAEKERFLPLCPDFVIELRSPSDSLEPLEEKMAEYLANGSRLGWLLDAGERRAFVYRPGRSERAIVEPSALSGEPELPGFVLELGEVWNPAW